MGDSYTMSPSVKDWQSLPTDLWTTWKTVRSNNAHDFEAGNNDRLNEKQEQPVVTQSHRSGPPPRGFVRRMLYGIGSVLSLLLYLLPRQGRPIRTKELHSMAYLNALRAYMALIIYSGHVCERNWHWVPQIFYLVPGLQFPIRGTKICTMGFFWISGYVNTFRILGFIHTKQPLKMLDMMSSTVFRRFFRLFIPVLPFTLFVIVGTQLGIVIPDNTRTIDMNDDLKNAIFKNPYWWWFIDTLRLINPFADIRGFHNGAFGSRVLPPLWSLCTEFRSTLMMSVFMIGTFKIPRERRNTMIWVLIPFFFYYEADWAAMAFIGMWFADCRQHRELKEKARISLPVAAKIQPSDVAEQSPLPTNYRDHPVNEKEDISSGPSKVSLTPAVVNNGSESRIVSFYRRHEKSILYAMFAYSFVIVFDPNGNERNTFFPNPLIDYLERPYWHLRGKLALHICLGAFCMFYPLDILPLLKKPLLTPFSQYLGELSFGIYVTHYVVRWIVWDARYLKYWRDQKIDPALTPSVTVPGWIVMTILVLWTSEIFRKFDNQVPVICKWIEGHMFEKS